jgi:hypothetical protein
MRLNQTLAALFSAFGLTATALAVDYPAEYGVVPSIVPPAPDETGRVNNVPTGVSSRAPTVDEFFARYDTNRDGVISWEEARQDPDLVAAFARADADRDGRLTRGEFQDAARIAAIDRRSAGG